MIEFISSIFLSAMLNDRNTCAGDAVPERLTAPSVNCRAVPFTSACEPEAGAIITADDTGRSRQPPFSRYS